MFSSKKYQLLSVLMLGCLTPIVLPASSIPTHAHTSQQEEQYCFEILAEYTGKDSRFEQKMTNAKIASGKRVDLSKYDTFLAHRHTNSVNNKPVFFASRNNIGTIRSNTQYIASQIVPFGEPSAFQFPYPYESDDSMSYGDFKEYVAYTHHIADKDDQGTFVSCGLLRVNPAPGKTHQDTHPDNYKTNYITQSGFGLLV